MSLPEELYIKPREVCVAKCMECGKTGKDKMGYNRAYPLYQWDKNEAPIYRPCDHERPSDFWNCKVL